MKLYTEEQVRSAMYLSNKGDYDTYSQILNQFTPIELPSDTAENTADYIDRHIVEAMVEVAKKPINFPSDEDIIKNAPVIPKNADDYLITNKIGFVQGAKWMKEQILKQSE